MPVSLSEGGVGFLPISLGEGGVAFLPVSLGEGGVAFLPVSLSENCPLLVPSMAFVPVRPNEKGVTILNHSEDFVCVLFCFFSPSELCGFSSVPVKEVLPL